MSRLPFPAPAREHEGAPAARASRRGRPEGGRGASGSLQLSQSANRAKRPAAGVGAPRREKTWGPASINERTARVRAVVICGAGFIWSYLSQGLLDEGPQVLIL